MASLDKSLNNFEILDSISLADNHVYYLQSDFCPPYFGTLSVYQS